MDERRVSVVAVAVERRKRGPKPRTGRAAQAIFCIRLTADERKDLEQVARDNGTTLTDVLREAVNEYVADYRESSVFHNP